MFGRIMYVLGVVMLFAPMPGYAVASQQAYWDSSVPPMIRELYEGFDPRKEPLEIEMIREWDEGDIHIEQLYFTGQVIDDVKTRIYAYRGAPRSGRRLPGVLYCHGGGQTAYLEWVRFWAKQGYVCVSFDYSGDTNKSGLPQYRREHFTRWGAAVEKMMAEFGGAPPEKRSPKGDSWYHFCLAARRSLTLLEDHSRVNPARIGAYGVSAGGYLCWLLAATDARVRTIVPIYGAGSVFRDTSGLRISPITADIERSRFLATPGSPEFYAPLVACPVLYLTASNDGAFSLDHAFDTIDRLGSKTVRLLYTPRWNHHVEPAEAKSLPLWMDWQLKGRGGPWPETPELEITSTEGVPRVRVLPDSGSPIERVEVYYALNTTSAVNRFWRSAGRVRRQERWHVAEAPFMSRGDRIYAFANVVYRSGARVSSRVAELSTSLYPALEPTLRREALVDTMETAENWYWVPAYPDPKLQESYFRPWTGPDGERGFTVAPFECDNPPFVTEDGTVNLYFGTHKTGDPQWRGGADDKALLLDCYAPLAPAELTVRAAMWAREGGHREYTARPEVARDRPGWVTLRMERSSFKDAEGKPLPGWAQVLFFGISGTATTERTPVFRDLRWERNGE